MIIYRCCSTNFRHRKMCMDGTAAYIRCGRDLYQRRNKNLWIKRCVCDMSNPSSNRNDVISHWNIYFICVSRFVFIEIFHEIGDYMSPGIYIYPFETELPSNLPTSCEGKYGFIRYLASANVIRPNTTTQTQTIAFTVIKPHNLNALSIVQVGLSKSWIFQVTRFLLLF